MKRVHPNRSGGRQAFTLVEMLTAISISIVITLALYSVFNEIQKAFRASMQQTDVLEGGRAAMALITDDLSQMAAAEIADAPNFVAQRPPRFTVLSQDAEHSRRNVRREFFFLTRQEDRWQGIGYRLQESEEGSGVARLLRFSNENTVMQATRLRTASQIGVMIDQFQQPFDVMSSTEIRQQGFQEVLEGVVHFRVEAYDSQGAPWTPERADPGDGIHLQAAGNSDETLYAFEDDKLPAFIDVELGIVERETLEQMRSFPNPEVKLQFLEERMGKIHLFRQRIPIRTARP